MNKKKGIPLIRKVLTCFIAMLVVMIFCSIPLYAVEGKIESELHPNIIAIENTNQLYFNSILDNYLIELQAEGYDVISNDFDIDLFKHFISNHSISSLYNEDLIKNSIKVNINSTQITIGTEIFYFKNSTDALTFVNKLNEQIKTEYSMIENVIIDKDNLSIQDILNKKIEYAKTQRQEIEQRQREQEAQKIRTYQSVSRSGIRRTVNAPMASYVYISSYFGPRTRDTHTGVDFAAAANTEVYAWKSGTIIRASWNGGYGNCIDIQHDDGTVTRYAHLNGYAVSCGQVVSQGQTIGYVGTTGNSSGYHLHFEIIINGKQVNPLNYL